MVRELNSCGSIFRVLALSATPGNDLKVCTSYCGRGVSCVNPSLPPVPPQAVQQVVSNLQLSHIELRAEDSFDIQPYTHRRKVELNVVPLEGEILLVKTAFLKVLSGIIGRLAKHGVVYSANPERLSKFALLQARDGFRQHPPPSGVHVSHYTLYVVITHSSNLVSSFSSSLEILSQTLRRPSASTTPSTYSHSMACAPSTSTSPTHSLDPTPAQRQRSIVTQSCLDSWTNCIGN